jgi:hypothetical protein
LGNAKILYARSEEDEQRFESIRQKLFGNLSNPAFTYKKALENLDVAMDLYRTMMFEEQLYKVRCLVGYIHHYLTVSVGCLNGTYQQDYTLGVVREVSKWQHFPERFLEYYQAILSASTTGELKSIAHLLIASARQFITGYKPSTAGSSKKPNYKWLADWYQELRTTWNRIYYYCQTGDADSAFRDACNLQNEFSIICEEFSLSEMDLLGSFNTQELAPLSQRAAELENIIVSAIESQGITIKRYDTLEAFLTAEK